MMLWQTSSHLFALDTILVRPVLLGGCAVRLLGAAGTLIPSRPPGRRASRPLSARCCGRRTAAAWMAEAAQGRLALPTLAAVAPHQLPPQRAPHRL